MNNKRLWEYDPDQDDEGALREALEASERESSFYSYPNAFYLAEPAPLPTTSSPYLQQPTPAAESLAPNTLPRLADSRPADSRYLDPLSQAERHRVADAARRHLASLYTDQEQQSTQQSAQPHSNLTDTRTQAERRRANNPFRLRHNIDRSNPFGPTRPNLGHEPYRDIWASQPTDRTPMTRPERVEDRVERQEAESVFGAMMGDEEVRGEVERSRARRLGRENVDDRRQFSPQSPEHERQEQQPLITALPPTRQITRHSGTQDQEQSSSIPAASSQAMSSDGGIDRQQMAPPAAQLTSAKNCGMCGQLLPLSMFAKGQGYQTRCAPCREKHNGADKANAEKRKEDNRRDEAAGHRVCKTCGQSLALELCFGGKKGSRGEKYYTKCFACRGEAEMRKRERK